MDNLIKLSSPATKQFWKVTVLHEDADLLALEKPLDLPATPGPDNPEEVSLVSLLHRDIQRAAPWAASRNLQFLKEAHRLDPSTGGVLLLAKSAQVLARLADRFGEEHPVIDYTALIRGNPPEDAYDVLIKLQPHPQRPGCMRASKREGKRARTLVRVVERFRGYAVLNCQPLTARVDQIPVHLKHLRLPLVGDRKYGTSAFFLSSIKPDFRLKPNRKERPLISRPALHATTLRLPHPTTGDELVIESPWAKDLSVAIKYLRRFRSAGSATTPASSESPAGPEADFPPA